MKKSFFFFIIFLNFTFAHAVTKNTQSQDYGAPPNAVSRGQSENAGIGDSPTGTTKEEAKKMRSRSESMGGAPNAGVGTGTGTGSGSTVGKEVGTGTVTAGSTTGQSED